MYLGWILIFSSWITRAVRIGLSGTLFGEGTFTFRPNPPSPHIQPILHVCVSYWRLCEFMIIAELISQPFGPSSIFHLLLWIKTKLKPQHSGENLRNCVCLSVLGCFTYVLVCPSCYTLWHMIWLGLVHRDLLMYAAGKARDM